jgi:hypothetical protein
MLDGKRAACSGRCRAALNRQRREEARRHRDQAIRDALLLLRDQVEDLLARLNGPERRREER